ncbi:hypothetical protein Y032_0033g2751 [Ancylostoma ceylanicum]|uniref:Uncharacterized protein n=1 Tax=Ancylostoma ceylanicum TaxID=53326 RepID=A0A016UML2_9BILA|nr:hypothetical protein Y032_0033g2751 [Ancylostoma ceylanicum]
MSRKFFAGGPLRSDYVMNHCEEEQRKEDGLEATPLERDAKTPPLHSPSWVPSQYVEEDLRCFIAVHENRNYQEFPSTIRRTPLVGNPVSASELRTRVRALSNTHYSPVIANGKLYFVSLESDAQTARSSTGKHTRVRSEFYE